MVMGADTIDIVLPKFLAFCEGCILVAHRPDFNNLIVLVAESRRFDIKDNRRAF